MKPCSHCSLVNFCEVVILYILPPLHISRSHHPHLFELLIDGSYFGVHICFKFLCRNLCHCTQNLHQLGGTEMAEDWNRTALLVIDMQVLTFQCYCSQLVLVPGVFGEIKVSVCVCGSLQKDFIEDWSPVALKGGKDIVPNVIKAVEVARQRGILIVWVISNNTLSLSCLIYGLFLSNFMPTLMC